MADPTTRTKQRAAALSVASNTVLVLGKLVVGVLTGSVAVVSEAVHSAMDLLAAIIAYTAVTLSGRPPDEDHPHGHGKIEDLSGAVEALLIFGAVVFIGYEAVQKLVQGNSVEHLYLGVIVMGASSVVNVVVSWYLQRIGTRTDSTALLADAAHLRTDVYTCLGVMVGLLLVYVTGEQWIDPLAALMVSLLIVREAWQITRRSVNVLLDRSLPAAELARVEQVLRRSGHSFHALRSRKSGPTRSIDLHLDVSPTATVEQVHATCDELEQQILEVLPRAQVLIHPEPSVELDSTRPVCALVIDILEAHRELFVDYADVHAHQRPDGELQVDFRLRLQPQVSVHELEQITAHLREHVRQHLPEAEVFVHAEATQSEAGS